MEIFDISQKKYSNISKTYFQNRKHLNDLEEFFFFFISKSLPLPRVYAKKEGVDNTLFALENSAIFLKELERYAKYVYELPKMYSAAIPDFAAGMFI